MKFRFGMKYRLRVYHLNKSGVSRYDFFDKVAAWEHYHMYTEDVTRGFFDRVEMWWRDVQTVATGLEGEQVWQLVQQFPKRIDNGSCKD